MNRKRWKTDFSTAATKADGAFDKIDSTIAECYKQAEINSNALVLGCIAPLECCYNPDVAPNFHASKKEYKR